MLANDFQRFKSSKVRYPFQKELQGYLSEETLKFGIKVRENVGKNTLKLF